MKAHGVALLGLAIVGCGSLTPLSTDGGVGGAGGGNSGVGGGGAIGTGGGGGIGTGGGAGGMGGGAGGMGGAQGPGGSSVCPPGQVWCPGCVPGSGMCSPGGCPGFACPSLDAGSVDASGACSTMTTAAACDARADCHSVFVDPHTCRCAALGCCAQFSTCAEGAHAVCKNVGIICTIASPYCEGQYVVSYVNGCYEGCVRMAECAP